MYPIMSDGQCPGGAPKDRRFYLKTPNNFIKFPQYGLTRATKTLKQRSESLSWAPPMHDYTGHPLYGGYSMTTDLLVVSRIVNAGGQASRPGQGWNNSE